MWSIGGFCKAQDFIKEWNPWPKTLQKAFKKTVGILRKTVELKAGCSCRTDIAELTHISSPDYLRPGICNYFGAF